jgi:excisionase family DNA binding protein
MEQLLTSKEAAKLLGIKSTTLSNWRNTNRGPAYIKGEKLVFYKMEDIEKYLESKKVKTKDSN